MNGQVIHDRPIRINPGTGRNPSSPSSSSSSSFSSFSSSTISELNGLSPNEWDKDDNEPWKLQYDRGVDLHGESISPPKWRESD